MSTYIIIYDLHLITSILPHFKDEASTQCMTVILSDNLSNQYRMFDSLGLNLAYEVLLLGVRVEGLVKISLMRQVPRALEALLFLKQTSLASIFISLSLSTMQGITKAYE
jgi:hypothetical protein